MNPLTLELPKALLHLAGKTLLEWSIERLHLAGCTDVVIATGWKRDLVEKVLTGLDSPPTLHTVYVQHYERGPLQTFVEAVQLIHGTINILNPVDLIISSRAVCSLVAAFPQDNPFALNLAIDYSATDGSNVEIGADGRVITIGKESPETGRNAKSAMLLAFSTGFPVYCAEALDRGDTTVLSVLNSLIAHQNSVFACPISEKWYDIDSIGTALQANRYLLDSSIDKSPKSIYVPSNDLMEVGDTVSLASGITLGKGTHLKGPCLIQKNCDIQEGCTIGPYVSIAESTILGARSNVHDAVIFGGSEIPPHSTIKKAFVYQSKIYSEEA